MDFFIAAEDMLYPIQKLQKNASPKTKFSERSPLTVSKKRAVFSSLSPRMVFFFGIGSFEPVSKREFQAPFALGMKPWHGSRSFIPIF
jgi:hypothetical protein